MRAVTLSFDKKMEAKPDVTLIGTKIYVKTGLWFTKAVRTPPDNMDFLTSCTFPNRTIIVVTINRKVLVSSLGYKLNRELQLCI